MYLRHLLLLTHLCTIFALSSQESAVNKIIRTGQTDNQTMVHLDVLSNRFGGRLCGSDAYQHATDWAVSQFTQWGLEVELLESGSVPVGFNRGPYSGRLVGEKEMALNFTTPSFSSGTKGLQKGHVLIEPKTLNEFNRMKGALKGAWVLVTGENTGWEVDRTAKGDSVRQAIVHENDSIRLLNDKIIQRHNKEEGKNDSLIPYKEIPALYYKEMREAGILGIIQSSAVPISTLYDRSVVKDSTMTFEKLPTTCDIKLDKHQYETIYRMVKEKRLVELEFNIRNHFKPGPVKYYSVIGRIKGTKHPDEYVLVSGHLDAFDIGTGGVDCGSGASVVLESARMIALSGAKPLRTMEFVLFAAEEFGLVGARAYVNQYKDRITKISNLFTRDGGPLAPIGINVPKSAYADFEKICRPIRQIRSDYPFEVTQVEPFFRPKEPRGQDATVFAVEGVPTLEFRCEDFKGYNFDYREIWHTPNDLYTKSIPEYQNQASTVTAIVSLGVANLPYLIDRKGIYKTEE